MPARWTKLTAAMDRLYEFDREAVTPDKLQSGSKFAGLFAGEGARLWHPSLSSSGRRGERAGAEETPPRRDGLHHEAEGRRISDTAEKSG